MTRPFQNPQMCHPGRFRPARRSLRRNALLFMAVLMSAAFVYACKGKQSGIGEGKFQGMAAPVTAAEVKQKTVPLEIQNIGNVAPFATVEIRARVGGTLQKVYFQEGEDVRKGQELFLIDPRPYEVSVKQAEAYLARDRAALDKAEKDLQRFSELVKDDYVTREQYDQARTTVSTMKATVEADEAALKDARLELSYCTICAPIDGQTGTLLVDEGNLVKANDTNPMVVINQIRPIKVSFSVPEQYLPSIRKRQAAEGSLPVAARIKQDHQSEVRGELTFVNNIVDTRTGMIELKATFQNEDRALWPGQFVNVVLTLGEQEGAIVVPSQAVQSGQEGDYVFIIKQDHTVEIQKIRVDRIAGREIVVAEGLSPGETVVTDGQLRLKPGVEVEIKGETRPEEGHP